jgi:hypothetical protein
VLRRMILAMVVFAGVLSWPGTAPALSGPAEGTIIEVYPGPDALKNALASANSGDVLNIHAGVYPEHVAINTSNLTLRSAGDGEVTVDGTSRPPSRWTSGRTGPPSGAFGLSAPARIPRSRSTSVT